MTIFQMEDVSWNKRVILKALTFRPLDKECRIKINFLCSQLKHMLWVLIRAVSMKQLF